MQSCACSELVVSTLLTFTNCDSFYASNQTLWHGDLVFFWVECFCFKYLVLLFFKSYGSTFEFVISDLFFSYHFPGLIDLYVQCICMSSNATLETSVWNHVKRFKTDFWFTRATLFKSVFAYFCKSNLWTVLLLQVVFSYSILVSLI